MAPGIEHPPRLRLVASGLQRAGSGEPDPHDLHAIVTEQRAIGCCGLVPALGRGQHMPAVFHQISASKPVLRRRVEQLQGAGGITAPKPAPCLDHRRGKGRKACIDQLLAG